MHVTAIYMKTYGLQTFVTLKETQDLAQFKLPKPTIMTPRLML